MTLKHSALEPRAHGTSRARIVDSEGVRFVFAAGQVSMDDTGAVLYPGDFRGQCRVVLEKLVDTLEKAGADRSDLVKITVFLTDFRYFPILAELRPQILASPGPASSAVQVSGLAHPDLMVEIEGVAMRARASED
jgi:2-iminobutanoate/2-iminopropanoate deaminase